VHDPPTCIKRWRLCLRDISFAFCCTNWQHNCSLIYTSQHVSRQWARRLAQRLCTGHLSHWCCCRSRARLVTKPENVDFGLLLWTSSLSRACIQMEFYKMSVATCPPVEKDITHKHSKSSEPAFTDQTTNPDSNVAIFTLCKLQLCNKIHVLPKSVLLDQY